MGTKNKILKYRVLFLEQEYNIVDNETKTGKTVKFKEPSLEDITQKAIEEIGKSIEVVEHDLNTINLRHYEYTSAGGGARIPMTGYEAVLKYRFK